MQNHMAFLFSGLYEPIPDIDLYLKRIEYRGDRKPTRSNLKELVRKNQTHIPYGNLDFYRNQSCPSLAIPDIFEKIMDSDWLAISKYRSGDILNRFANDTKTISGNAISWIPNIGMAAADALRSICCFLPSCKPWGMTCSLSL